MSKLDDALYRYHLTRVITQKCAECAVVNIHNDGTCHTTIFRNGVVAEDYDVTEDFKDSNPKIKTVIIEEAQPLFLYSQRNKLANLFKQWAKDNEVAICPTNLITWLSGNELLNMNKVFELLEKTNNGKEK